MIAVQSRNPDEFLLLPFEPALLVTDETDGCLQTASHFTHRKLSLPHTAAQIDFDGDCLSDFFITITDIASGKTYYEIYLRREKEQSMGSDEEVSLNDTNGQFKGLNSLCLVTRQEVPVQANNIFSFADIDRDAMVDMMFVNKKDLKLHVYYNKLQNQQVLMQQKGSTSQSQTTAFGLKKLCSATNRPVNKVKDIFSPFTPIIEERNVVSQPISLDQNVAEVYADEFIPGRIYLGDITSDGFPDLLITLKYIDGTSRSHVLINEPCSTSESSVCTVKAQKAKRRQFNVDTNAYQSALDAFDKTKYATFFDLNENSMMDLLVVRTAEVSGRQSAIVSSIYNNYGRDAFFLKTRMVSDGALGTTVNSASFRCVLTSLEDEKFMVMGGQSGQTAYQALQMPFSQIGIGRSNNFIESFTVSAYVNGSRSLRMWTPIIPKSVLFVVTQGSEEVETWKLDVLIKPSEKMIMIILVDAVFLLILGLVIIVLHLLEKSEDRREKQINVIF
ncbi:hypothetical protein FGO68_gene2124 [Halteria grandinella]|uniref:T-cell immunomodulatory protein TIP C2 domain-containing protein n=1 Tax=Halteria grandinella TaxID=5974 RepID=A0A8J8SXG9_HALGN|nr:hypothetical protein FGO68_gene2124 [Halteria grandinella]